MDPSFLIYGANGYSGRLIAERARARNLRPTLAGRNQEEIETLAKALDLPYRVFSLDDRAALDAALESVPFVLHCAGPFSHTSATMIAACLRTERHYLDITGEIGVFEAIAERDADAKQKKVMLLPGVGFDVVPSDCLAAHVASKVPGADRLTLAFLALGRASRGTATTAIESVHLGAAVRQDGRIVHVPAAHKTRTFDFGDRTLSAVTIPWGDVSTAYFSTKIPNIEVYSAFPPATQRFIKWTRVIGPLLGTGLVQRVMKSQIRARPAGPTPDQRARGMSVVYAEAEDRAHKKASARFQGPEGYTLTAITAVAIAEKLLKGEVKPGFQTPSLAFGKDFILELEGFSRTDLS
jgi:short subunit dehydrogenase-like uncharacterized protein